jgi:hypothetical protein
MVLDEQNVKDFVDWFKEEYSDSINKIEWNYPAKELFVELVDDIHPKEFADSIADIIFTHLDFYSSLYVNIYGFGKDKKSAVVLPFNSDYDDLGG